MGVQVILPAATIQSPPYLLEPRYQKPPLSWPFDRLHRGRNIGIFPYGIAMVVPLAGIHYADDYDTYRPQTELKKQLAAASTNLSSWRSSSLSSMRI